LDDDLLQAVRIAFVQRARLVHGGEAESAFTLDLGVRGVFVERAEPLPEGQRVDIEFALPGNTLPLVATCRVAWRRQAGREPASPAAPAGVGLEFVEMSETDRDRLRGYLEEYLREEPRRRRFARPWPSVNAAPVSGES
jgi:hypothetical protein